MDDYGHGRRLQAAIVALLLLLAPAAGYAQTETSAPGERLLIVELAHNPFVVATDYKVTDLDGEFGQLAGGYIGLVIEDTLFVGGAVHLLGPRARRLLRLRTASGSPHASHRSRVGELGRRLPPDGAYRCARRSSERCHWQRGAAVRMVTAAPSATHVRSSRP